MESAMEIFRIVLPILIAGAIALFVILRLKAKQKKGTLGKRESQSEQTLLDSMIPLGMVFGSGLGIVLSMIFPFSLGTGITFGAAIGLLAGYIAYELYGKREQPTHKT